jgi:acylphosphatase
MSGRPLMRVRVLVEGRVQGVNFRYSAYQEATRLGVAGWARNLPDGRVEAAYEGSRDAVEQMLTWTRHGPDWARVTGVAVYDEVPEEERGFGIS